MAAGVAAGAGISRVRGYRDDTMAGMGLPIPTHVAKFHHVFVVVINGLLDHIALAVNPVLVDVPMALVHEDGAIMFVIEALVVLLRPDMSVPFKLPSLVIITMARVHGESVTVVIVVETSPVVIIGAQPTQIVDKPNLVAMAMAAGHVDTLIMVIVVETFAVLL
jgi:hypothetical protein